jgi:hypothetical protein
MQHTMVTYPLIRVNVLSDSYRHAGNCYVYRYIDGITLDKYWERKIDLERLVIFNQIMPQILQGK